MKVDQLVKDIFNCAGSEVLPFLVGDMDVIVCVEQVVRGSIYPWRVLKVSWSREWNSFVIHVGHGL